MHWEWGLKWKETEITVKDLSCYIYRSTCYFWLYFLHTYSIIYRNMACQHDVDVHVIYSYQNELSLSD